MRKTKKYREHLLESLKDPKEAMAYLSACIDKEDPKVFLLALKDVMDAWRGIKKLAKKKSLSD